jgi:hypothetical protein
MAQAQAVQTISHTESLELVSMTQDKRICLFVCLFVYFLFVLDASLGFYNMSKALQNCHQVRCLLRVVRDHQICSTAACQSLKIRFFAPLFSLCFMWQQWEGYSQTPSTKMLWWRTLMVRRLLSIVWCSHKDFEIGMDLCSNIFAESHRNVH